MNVFIYLFNFNLFICYSCTNVVYFSLQITFILFLDVQILDPCNPSPCGFNSECYNGICTCLKDYYGDPYIGCKPECITNMECPIDKICSSNKCTNPCPGACATTAECIVYNHILVCSCPQGMTGNAFSECYTTESK